MNTKLIDAARYIVQNDRAFYETYILHNNNLASELEDLIGVPQDVRRHPEGDAFTHTMLVTAAAMRIAKKNRIDVFSYDVLTMAALTHDLGKATTTEIREDGTITSYGHDDAGVFPAWSLLTRANVDRDIIESVLPLVSEHMVHVSYKHQKITNRAIRRIIKRLYPATLDQWIMLVEADYAGRTPLEPRIPEEAMEIYTRGKNILENERDQEWLQVLLST